VILLRRIYSGNPSYFENHPRATLRTGNERETSRTLILQRCVSRVPARRMTEFALNSGFRRLGHISPQISQYYNGILFSASGRILHPLLPFVYFSYARVRSSLYVYNFFFILCFFDICSFIYFFISLVYILYIYYNIYYILYILYI